MSSALIILGGLGVFLFGLRVMSVGLQKIAGTRLREVLARMTKNRFAGIISGFAITASVQSSSATTVLVVSFANAGLLTFVQAMGLVMGANIGTTITAWLVSLLGFKVKISAFALPIIGIAFPLSFSRNVRAQQLSEVFVGFGLLFLGLKFLKEGVPDLEGNPEALEFLANLTQFGFGSMLLFVIVGSILTVIVQSSSAASAITITMAAKGWIDFDLAACMILGENVGTTITATLAALGSSKNAVRVARFHTIFNLIGVAWVLPLMALGPVLGLVDMIIPGDPAVAANTPQHLAAFHTFFNVTNTFVLMWFVSPLEKAVMKMVPEEEGEGEEHSLTYMGSGQFNVAELATVEARRAIQEMFGVCREIFGKVARVLTNPDESLPQVIKEVQEGEALTDEMEEDIVQFCSQLASAGSSARLGEKVAHYLDMTNDIERIGDHCSNLVRLAQRRWNKGYTVDEETMEDLEEMLGVTTEFMELTLGFLSYGSKVKIGKAKLLESKLNDLRDSFRKKSAERMQKGQLEVRAGIVYMDMFTNMEKIGDYCWNVCAVLRDSAR